MGKLLEVRNLTKRYYEGTAENKVVDGINMEVDKGEFVVIMGASGSGKTSLLHLIAGIDDFDGGTVRYTITDEERPPEGNASRSTLGHTLPGEGRPSEGNVSRYSTKEEPDADKAVDFSHMGEKAKTMFRRANIGIVFQQQCLVPDLTVYENIMLPMMLACRPAGTGKRGRRALRRSNRDFGKDAILGLCSRFGLKEHVRKYPSQLSGGQQQRAAILRSVINEPPLLLCDEPTGSLNSAQTDRVMDLLDELNKNGQTIILVTHDMKVAARGKRVVYIEDGHVGGELRFTDTSGAGKERTGQKDLELRSFLEERGW